MVGQPGPHHAHADDEGGEHREPHGAGGQPAGPAGHRRHAVSARTRSSPVSRKSLVVYLMAGAETPVLAEAAVEGGADIVESDFPSPTRSRTGR